MRASLYLVGFAAASLVGAGLFEIGCSSSSSTPTAAADAASEGGDDGGGDDAGDAAPVCTPIAAGMRADTIDGGAAWGCIQSMCNMKALAACSSDNCCNNAVLSGLECIVSDGGTATTCFIKSIGAISTNPNVGALSACLTSAVSACGGIDGGGNDGGTHDGGTDGGSHDGGTDGSTDSGSTTDASDAGIHLDAAIDSGLPLDAAIDSGLPLDVSDAGDGGDGH